MSKFNNQDGIPSYAGMLSQASSMNSFKQVPITTTFLKTQQAPFQKNITKQRDLQNLQKPPINTKTSLGQRKDNQFFKNSEQTFLKKQAPPMMSQRYMANPSVFNANQTSAARLTPAQRLQQKQLVMAYQNKPQGRDFNKNNQKSVPASKKNGMILKQGMQMGGNRNNKVFSPPPQQNQNTRAMFHKPTMNNLAKSEMSDLNSQSPRPSNTVDIQGFYNGQTQLSPSHTQGVKSPRYDEVVNYPGEGSRTQLNTHRVKQRTDLQAPTNQFKSYREMPSGTNNNQGNYNFLKTAMITQSQREINPQQKMTFVEGENFSFNEKRNIAANNFSPIPLNTSNIQNAYSTQNLNVNNSNGVQVSTKTVQNSMQRQMNSIQNKIQNTNIRQNNKTLSQYLMNGKQGTNPVNTSQTQLQPQRIQQRGLNTELPSARVFSQDANNNAGRTYIKDQLNLQTPLSEVSNGRYDSQEGRRDLLKAGVSRRMEGVGANYATHATKEQAHRLNFNSMDRENEYDDRSGQQSARPSNLSNNQRQPNYMKNTQSRELHLLSKNNDAAFGSQTSFGLADGIIEDDSINEVKSAPTKRNKSAYKSNQNKKNTNMVFTGTQITQQSSQKASAYQAPPGPNQKNQLSILSFDNMMQMKTNGANGQYLTSRQQVNNQTTGKMSHRRDRSQRIAKNKNNGYEDDDFGSEVDDTQVISIGEAINKYGVGFEGNEQDVNVEEQMDYPDFLQADIQKKKLISASVAQLANINKYTGSKQTPTPNKRAMNDMNRGYGVDSQGNSVATPNIYKPNMSQKNKTINFIQRNIKRAGQSKERLTGLPLKSARDNIVSPTRTSNMNGAIYSIGSIGSVGSPLSMNANPSTITNDQSSKRIKKARVQKQLNFNYTQMPSNLYGNTGTTIGTTGGTGSIYNNFTNGGQSMKIFKDQKNLAQLGGQTRTQNLRNQQNMYGTNNAPGGGLPSGSQRSLAQFQSQKLQALKTQRAAPAGDMQNFDDNDIASINSGEMLEKSQKRLAQNVQNIQNLAGNQSSRIQKMLPQSPLNNNYVVNQPIGFNFNPNSMMKQAPTKNKMSYVSQNSATKSKQSLSQSQSTQNAQSHKTKSRGGTLASSKGPLVDSQYIQQIDQIDPNNINMYDIDDINADMEKQQEIVKKSRKPSNAKSQKSGKSLDKQSNKSKELMIQIERQNKQIRQQDLIYNQKKEAQEAEFLSKNKQLNIGDKLNKSNEKINSLREQLNQKGFQNELESQTSDDIDNNNFIINQPNQKSQQLAARSKGGKNAAGTGLISPKSYGKSPDVQKNNFMKDFSNSDGGENKDDNSVERKQQESIQISVTNKNIQLNTNSENNQPMDSDEDPSQMSENQDQATIQMINQSQVTTQTELQRYANHSKNLTRSGMIQATIYHIRKPGENVYNPQERAQYYSDDFLNNQRHVNYKVEQELEEFKIEISEKVAENTTKFFSFPRPGGQNIRMNTDSNIIDVSHSQSQYHELPNYEDQEYYHKNQKEYADQSIGSFNVNNRKSPQKNNYIQQPVMPKQSSKKNIQQAYANK